MCINSYVLESAWVAWELTSTRSLSPYIGNLSFLRELDLVGNSFYNQIPQEIGGLRRLEALHLANNSISGKIPSNLSACSKLTLVDMRGNQLIGEIPASLGLLSNLKVLGFVQNSLRGSIPPLLGNLSSLEELRLTNTISGIIPVALFNLSNIRALDIGTNKIQGQNQISGQIPISISNASNLNVLDFDGNMLDGNVPSLEKLDNLFDLELGINHFGHGKKGGFPECISNFSSNLRGLGMGANNILGKIPDEIGNFVKLETLHVAHNQLLGPIPFDIGRLWKLNIFYAESKCQNLPLLDRSYNNLSGPIPPEILGLSSLSIVLSLSSNSLTGELPVELEKLKNLGLLDVSHNRLSGLLPNNLGSCLSLVELYLEGNLFEGPIPPSLSSLRGLGALDVSNNNLSGGILEFLVRFGALKYLNLSFNNFEGVIPSEGVFKNTSAIFVEGNNKLCGGILELHFSRCNSKTSSKASVKLKIAIIVVILGVILVFTCLLILWFRKKKEGKPTTTCAEHSLLQLSYQSILRATNGFCMENLVGSGSFGSVYKGILAESGVAIAVKVLNLLNQRASKSFFTECEALKSIRHRNLVKFMENGSLEDWLHPYVTMNESEMTRNLNFFKRVNMAIDVAHVLQYLHHHCETSIIHCDLKPSNILLDGEMVRHIGDFGLAKILSADRLNYSSNQSSSLGLRGTIGYAPPEYGMGSELSTKGDVYSYGILLLEMFTGKRPTDERFKEGLSLHKHVKAALPNRVIEIIDPILLQKSVRGGTIIDITLNENRLGNDRHLQCLNLIFEIGLTCSAQSPSERMDMSDIVTKLCSIRDKLLRPTQVHREIQTS
ncbi:hypothetical protein GOBAR_AA32008 [Gossypium barbadense]|uniref:non-specific serine/threonine protein kinase n=1 Tax=Gossypium barbadense TaxID=3634 RepID=A0A2P5WC66_GOSBA|nr:hypothetical protein GOBAR_AA32008 [Gossypium barbadense]